MPIVAIAKVLCSIALHSSPLLRLFPTFPIIGPYPDLPSPSISESWTLTHLCLPFLISCYDRASWTIIFLSSILLPLFPSYYTTDTLPSLLVIALSWIYPLIPRLGQDALWTVRLLPYLLHALPSPILYYLCVHQYLLMCTLVCPFVPVSPHRCLMYHCTFCARFLTP